MDTFEEADEWQLREIEAECKGHYLKASIEPGGKYTITNRRNNISKSYTAK